MMNVRKIPSAPLQLTSEAQMRRSSAAVQCTVSRCGSRQTGGTPQLRCELHCASLWQRQQREVGMSSSSTLPLRIGTRLGPNNTTDRCCCHHPLWRSRNRGLLRRAHRVTPGDRRQPLWKEHVKEFLNNFGFATCTADPTLGVHRESEVRSSTHVDDGCAVGLLWRPCWPSRDLGN